VDYYQRVLNISQENGEVWGSLGHCYLMMDDLQKAYTAYQQALYRLPNPKVRPLLVVEGARDANGARRIPSYGMGLESCMIGTDRWSMQRRRSPAC
jgi:tetratricopeptide (TPR) repeat protein